MRWEKPSASSLLSEDGSKRVRLGSDSSAARYVSLGSEAAASSHESLRAGGVADLFVGKAPVMEGAQTRGRWSYSKHAWARIQRQTKAAEAKALRAAAQSGASAEEAARQAEAAAAKAHRRATHGANYGNAAAKAGLSLGAVSGALSGADVDGGSGSGDMGPDDVKSMGRYLGADGMGRRGARKAKREHPGTTGGSAERRSAVADAQPSPSAAHATGQAAPSAAASSPSGTPPSPAPGGAKATFAEKQLSRKHRQAIWREKLARSRGAKNAIAAAKARAEQKAASSAAAKSAWTATAPIRAMGAPVAIIGGSAVAAMLLSVFLLASVIGIVSFTVVEEGMGGGPGGEALAEAALAEYDSGPHTGGRPYWSHVGFGSRVEWCSCFVKYCWDKCGFDKTIGGPTVGVGMANSWIIWANGNKDKASMFAMSASYKPQPGDILVIGSLSSSTHVGICVSEADKDGRYTCVEGNYGDKVAKTTYFAGSVWNYVCRPNYPDVEGSSAKAGGRRTGKEIDFGSGAKYSASESAFVAEWAPKIDRFFKNHYADAPLSGHGADFARSAYRNKVDPRLFAALSILESTGGRFCYEPFNAWGWGANDSGYTYHSFKGWADSIEYVTSHFAAMSVYQNAKSITEVDATYCPWRDRTSDILALFDKMK